MVKIVRYNGGTFNHYGCSDPAQLVLNKEYEVVSQDVHDFYTNYTLRGVKGTFNSAWFDVVSEGSSTFLVLSSEVPTVGKRFQCYLLNFSNGKLKLNTCYTSVVEEVEYLGNNIYQFVTHSGNVYIVMVD